ncbi:MULTISPECIES: glycoside hydrolase family 3 C-terminal domain-containing protein [unclassified Rathayibacter]|uniref:glycoside hydrolase family 3 C-terminal domain-containing protein n=1 Tax=unclassified Rathayibacter TaxID=2609250 RepID=UPI00104BBA50|nr:MULTISPECIES: glycoside hydrolase family 3 C-terminal domain-containing protein [unclassified Rathayibacter]TCL79468.1 beta-glucosidase [Rathayibacter sp. PhB192]TCM25263.1 beta-glucosidase [Rathayibacter sp. PhB179]
MFEPESTVDDVVADLSDDELARLTSGSDFWNSQGLERIGLLPIMVADGPHGLRKQSADSAGITLHGAVPATCFPTAAALASTWDPRLLHEIGSALGAEARAERVGVLLGPGVNIKRHPLNGRNFEYLSEDPLLAGLLGAALVRGVQSKGVGASVKHFACNNQETNRARISADVDERTLREIYLRPFERVVRTARPWTLMTANNRINGVYASEHAELLGIARHEWGFDGAVISDWGSVYDRVAALRAGLDLEMPANAHADEEVLAAVSADPSVRHAAQDSARNLLRLAERIAPADGSPVDADAHHRLARVAAAEACVLLTNDGMLPLEPEPGQRIAIIGAFATSPRFQGAGSSRVTPTRVDDALESLRAAVPEGVIVEFAPGFGLDDTAADESLRAEAVDLARGADAVLVFLGLPEGDEAEGADRTEFALPIPQRRLLDAVLTENDRVAVVLSNGSVVEMNSWADRPAAVLEAWLSGQAGGSAVVDVLLGTVNPSGRLAETVPIALTDCPANIGWPGEEGRTLYGEGIHVGYRYYDSYGVPVAFPFGHGLSYTAFEHTATATVTEEGGVLIDSVVTNVGGREGREVVQVYANHITPGVHRPRRELVGFGDITLPPGASGSVRIAVAPQDLAYWSIGAHDWVVTAGPLTLEIGASSHDIRGTLEVVLPGNGVRPPVTLGHTLQEWLEDPESGPLVREAFGLTNENDPLPAPLDDPEVLKLVGGTTMGKFAHFGMGIDQPALERILEKRVS